MKFTSLAAAGILAVLPLGMQTELMGRENESAKAVDLTDLWGLWREGFEKYEAAEQAAKKESRRETAAKLYNEARSLFLNIRRQNPNWNKEVIDYRISLCERRIQELDKPRRDALERARLQKAAAEKSLKEEVEKLRLDLRKARLEILELKNSADKNARSAAQVKSLMTEKADLEGKLSASAVQLDTLKRKLVNAERSSELNKKLLEEKTRSEELKKRIKTLENRISALSVEKDSYASRAAETSLKLKNAENRVRDLSAALESVEKIRKENQKMKETIASAEKNVAKLRSDLERSARTADDLRNQVARIRSGKEVLPSMKKMEDDLQLARKEGEYLRAQVATLSENLKKMNANEARQAVERRQLAVELAKAVSEQDVFRKENMSLKIRLQEAERNAGASKKEYAALAAERDTLRRELKALSQKQEELRKAADQASLNFAELQKLRGLYAQITKANELLRAELEAHKKDLAALQQSKKIEISNVQKNSKAELDKVRAENTRLAADSVLLKQRTAELDSARKTNDGLTAENNALKQRSIELDKVRRSNVILYTEAETLKKRVSELEKTVAEKQREVISMTQTVELLRKEFSKAKDSADAAEKALQVNARTTKTIAENSKVDAAEIALLKKQLAESKTQFNSLEKQYAARQKSGSDEIAGLHKQLSAAQERVAELEKKLAQPADWNTKPEASDLKLKQQLEVSRAQYESLKKRLEERTASSTNEIAGLRKQLADAQIKIADQQKKLSHAAASTQNIQQNAAKTSFLEQQLSTARAQQTELEKKLAQAESDLRKTVADSTSELEKLRKANQELNEKITDLRKNADAAMKTEIRKLSATVTELNEGKVQYENALRSLTKLRDSLTARNTALANDLTASKKEIASLKESLVKSASKAESDRRNNELLDKLGRLEKTNFDLIQEQKKLQERIRKLNGSLDASKKDLAESQNSVLRYRNELKRWSDDPAKVKDGVIARKDEAISSLVKEGEDLRKELATLKAELSMSRDEIRRVRSLAVSVARKYQKTRSELLRLRHDEQTAAEKGQPVSKPVDTKKTVAKKTESGKPVIEVKPSEPELVKTDINLFKEAFNEAKRAEKSGDSAGALMNYWRAADANPNSSEAYAGLARIYLKRGEKSSAAKAYAKAVELGFPKDVEIEKKLKE